MKEVLYKIFVFCLLFNFCFLQDDIKIIEYISLNNYSHQESITSISFNFIHNQETNILFTFQNWFTDNLYLSGSLLPIKENNDLYLNHSLNLGYGFNFDRKHFKNLILNFGYNKMRYNQQIENNKNISLAQIFLIKVKNVWLEFSYNFLDMDEGNAHQSGFNITTKLKEKFFIKCGLKHNYYNHDESTTSFLGFGYSL